MKENDNNGWIKINSEEDLPKFIGQYFVFNSQKSDIYYFENNTFWKNQWKNITHYQPILKPQPPLY